MTSVSKGDHVIPLTWGRSGQADWIQWRMCKTPALFRYPRSEPDCAIWSFPGQIKLTFGRRSRRRTNIPLAAVGAQEDDTILYLGFLGHVGVRFVHLDPPELIKSWKI